MRKDIDDTKDRKRVRRIKRKLGKTYTGVGEKRARQFMHIVNSIYKKTGDKGRAYAGAHSTLQRLGTAKHEGIDSEMLIKLIVESLY